VAVANQPSILVTGGCGFVGVNLARVLAPRGWRLLAFDNLSTGTRIDGEVAGYEVIEGDVRDLDALREVTRGADYIVHLAAHTNVIESIDDPQNDVDLNVGGTLNALIAARDNGVGGFVFASSNAPLGEVEPPTREDKVPKPLSPYGASKLAGEGLCSAFHGSYGVPTTVLRFSNVYGPYSYHKGSVVAAFMKRALDGDPLIIYGDGDQTRDFVHVADLAGGIVQALESGLGGETFHLGSGTETSVNELARLIVGLFSDRPVEIEHRPERPGEILRNYSDISKARSMFGFDPGTSLAGGLAETRDWFLEAYGS